MEGAAHPVIIVKIKIKKLKKHRWDADYKVYENNREAINYFGSK